MLMPDMNVLIYANRIEHLEHDTDFARFDGLRWRHPFEGGGGTAPEATPRR